MSDEKNTVTIGKAQVFAISIPGFWISRLDDTSFWFERDGGKGMRVSAETMEKIFKEFM